MSIKTYGTQLKFRSFISTNYRHNNSSLMNDEVNKFLDGDDENRIDVVKMDSHADKEALYIVIWYYNVQRD